MIYLFFILWAKLAGEVEAFLYSQKGSHALEDNEHKWLMWQRYSFGLMALVGGLYVWLLGFPMALLLGFSEGIAAKLAFSFFHNGWYSVMRARIKGRPLENTAVYSFYWRYTSPSDSSKINFNFVQRRNKFYISLAVLVITYTLYFILR